MAFLALQPGCESPSDPVLGSLDASTSLQAADVESLIVHAVEQADRLGERITVAVTDREGNVLGVFRMDGAPLAPRFGLGLSVFDADSDTAEAIQKARTAAFLSSNQHGFTTLTACFITQKHFPPETTNLSGGPLFGVPLSSLPASDIQPRGSGLTGAPGGVPVFKNGDLVGGLGVNGGSNGADFGLSCLCSCELVDEIIARGAILGYEVPPSEQGDVIFIDGIRLLYGNATAPQGDFSFEPGDLPARGAYLRDPRSAPSRRIPFEGPVILPAVADDPARDFSLRGSALSGGLSLVEVTRIIDQARSQADRTRAAIRRPIGTPARVFIAVVDLDGTVLGLWRTPDATLFSMDVAVQKARTVAAFSSPTCTAPAGNCPAPTDWVGRRIRDVLGLAPGDPLAMTSRAVGFLAQDFFPPGIDEELLDRPLLEGPLLGIQGTLATDPTFGNLGPLGNGLTIFPGGIPLYRNGVLVGGIGVSGDGVDQDDRIAAAGAAGFEPPTAIRCDQFFFDGVRLPYVKFPRQAEVD